jgi:hypothetical protein
MAAILIVAACGGASSVAPTDSPDAVAASLPPRVLPTARPAAVPSPSLPAAVPSPSLPAAVTPSPTPAQTPTPVVSAKTGIAALKIGAPYKLVANAANAALKNSFSFDVAGTHISATMDGREIRKSSVLVGFAFVLEFTGIPMSRQVFDAAAKGGATNAGGTLSFTTISGKRVALIKTPQALVGMYVLHAGIVMVVGVTPDKTKTLLTSVIKAN